MLDFRVRNVRKLSMSDFSGRRNFLLLFIMACMLLLIGRAIDLQVFNKQFLKEEGDKRQIDDVSVSAYRGMIKDRNGDPLAISTPVESVGVNPRELKFVKEEQIKQMEKLLSLPNGKISELIKQDDLFI